MFQAYLTQLSEFIPINQIAHEGKIHNIVLFFWSYNEAGKEKEGFKCFVFQIPYWSLKLNLANDAWLITTCLADMSLERFTCHSE